MENIATKFAVELFLEAEAEAKLRPRAEEKQCRLAVGNFREVENLSAIESLLAAEGFEETDFAAFVGN